MFKTLSYQYGTSAQKILQCFFGALPEGSSFSLIKLREKFLFYIMWLNILNIQISVISVEFNVVISDILI